MGCDEMVYLCCTTLFLFSRYFSLAPSTSINGRPYINGLCMMSNVYVWLAGALSYLVGSPIVTILTQDMFDFEIQDLKFLQLPLHC